VQWFGQRLTTIAIYGFGLLATAACGQTAPNPVPRPKFQGDFFGEMPRVFCILQKVDLKRKVLTIKQDGSGAIREVPIREDTEIHFRDSWGELSDYFPGQHVMLFLYIDDDKNWTYPRAVQDEIHVSARHGWFAKVLKVDTVKRTVLTQREEKNSKGEVTKTIDKEFAYFPDVKVWKGDKPGGIETLLPGDEVIQQLVEKEGLLVATEIFDRKGDDAVRIAQDSRHKADQERLGLPATINDLEPVSGSVVISVAWSGSDRAKSLKPGEAITLSPTDGSKPFAALVGEMQNVDTRQRIQLIANARVVSRLACGQSLRLFLPGTGPSLPTGRAGLPNLSK
jgi:hypothetical protein